MSQRVISVEITVGKSEIDFVSLEKTQNRKQSYYKVKNLLKFTPSVRGKAGIQTSYQIIMRFMK